MAPATSKMNLKLAIDVDEDWSGWADAKQRRKVQNRLNQRAARQRKALERERAQQRLESKSGIQALRLLKPKLIGHSDRISREVEGSQAVIRHQRIPSSIGTDSLRGLHPVFEDYQARKMFHTALILWPMMGQILIPGQVPIEQVLFRITVEDELRLDATIYAQWTVMFSQSAAEARAPLLALSRVLKRVREAIATDSITETVLFCILVLSGRPLEPAPVNRLGHGLFRPPVPQAGCINYIGTVECKGEHIDIARQIVRQRGGLSAIKTPSFPEHLQYIDLLDASQRVVPPAFELCHSYRHVLETEMAARRPPPGHADAFDAVDDHFREIILDLRHCCRVLEELCADDRGGGRRADLAALPWRMLPTYRETVHHRLLGLPRGRAGSEVCRLAALVFSYGVALPLPDPRPIRGLARELARALGTPRYSAAQDRRLLFWAAMLGALASFDDDDDDDDGRARPPLPGHLHLSFVARLRALVLAGGLGPGLSAGGSWTAARSLLERFLWLGRACDDGARRVWDGLFVDPVCYAGGAVARCPRPAV